MAKHIHIHFRTGDDGPTTKPRDAKRYEQIHGVPVSIETPKGGLRSGSGWSVIMPAGYGFIDDVPGADGDSLDCYLGPDLSSDQVYVVDQLTLDGEQFDEHKCFLAFSSIPEALAAYMSGHHLSGDTFGAITPFTMSGFKEWMASGTTTKPLAWTRATVDADWKESEHERKNNGEFGSGNVGKKAKAASGAERASQESELAKAAKSLPLTPHDKAWAARAANQKAAAAEAAKQKPKPKSSARPGMSAAPVNRDKWPEHIKALKLPPAWKDVHISDDPESPLQAMGVDAAGRSQRVYSKRFADSQSIIKFKRGDKLVKDAPRILMQLAAGRASKDPKVVSHADCASLIMATGIRPGSDSDTGAKVKAYGASTLLGQHVVIEGDKVRLKFTGKKGVALDMPVDDKAMAKMLRARKQTAGADGRLFGPVTGGSLLNYVHKNLDTGAYKTKDFRTLMANHTASTEVAKWKAPENLKEYKSSVLAVAKVVAAKLGNTPTVALRSYINPVIFAPWKGDFV